MDAGEPHDIRPIAPCEARRIEAGIFNYGSDMTIDDTPFHVMGLERLVEEQDADYIGKAALEEHPARRASTASWSASRSPATRCRSSCHASAGALSHDGKRGRATSPT